MVIKLLKLNIAMITIIINDDMHSGGDQECNDDECDNGEDNGFNDTQPIIIVCNKVCCSDEKKIYQPRDSKMLALFTNKNHRFLQVWYYRYKWKYKNEHCVRI